MTNFQKFQDAYKIIILQSLAVQMNKSIPGISFKNSLYSPKIKQEFLKSFKNIDWFYQNDEQKLLYIQSVINQSPGSIDYPGTLCNEILKIKKYSILKNSDVLKLINSNWKYFNQLKKYGLPIKVLKFDFSNNDEILNAFKLIYENNEVNQLILNSFIQNCNASGAQLIFDDICILMFNSAGYTKKTILHEFTHYIQRLLNVQKIDVKQNLDKTKLDFLNLSSDDLKMAMEVLQNEDQIIPNVNEFCQNIHDVFKQYQKMDNDLKWSSMFSEYFLKVILNSKNVKQQKLFKIFKKVSNNDMLSLYVVIGCYIYNIDWNKIRKIILQSDKFEE